jgi:hypothetical protein
MKRRNVLNKKYQSPPPFFGVRCFRFSGGFLRVLVLALSLLVSGCGFINWLGFGADEDSDTGGNTDNSVAIAFLSASVEDTQEGGSRLSLVFDRVIDGLAADDITVKTGYEGLFADELAVPETDGDTEPETEADTKTVTYTLTLAGAEKSGWITVGAGKSGYRITPATQTVRLYKGVPENGAGGMTSIKQKFAVTEEGKDGVAAVFTELHKYIQNGGLGASTVIRTGDWIDLEGGLAVEAYAGYGEFSAANAAIVPQSPPFTGYEGRKLRLIVVGINSFIGRNDNGNATPHVVFQFQNLPASRRTHSAESNIGYGETEMRMYLTPVAGDDNSGTFYTGLLEAGIPEQVLWAPIRYVSKRTAAEKITDLVWLPTEWEMFGQRTFSYEAHETSGNQVKLEYYSGDPQRIKYRVNESTGTVSVPWYRLASPFYTTTNDYRFCIVESSGKGGYNSPSVSSDFAPAFCVR